VFNTAGMSTIFQLYHGSQLNQWRKMEYLEKITDLPSVTHIKYKPIIIIIVIIRYGAKTISLQTLLKRRNNLLTL
jgi:hypothetical protein